MTHERLERRFEEREEREERVAKHANRHQPVWGEATRREVRAQRAGFGTYAEEERHNR